MILNKAFIVEYVNNKSESMLGYEAGGLLGKNFREFLFNKDLPFFEIQAKRRMQGEGTT